MRRARHNPSATRELKRPFVVLVRRFDPTGEELARWEPLYRDDDGTTFFSEVKAKAAALNPPRDADLHVGDLITVVPVDAISDIDNQAHKLFVVTPGGVEVAPKVPKDLGENLAWTAAWGGDARVMLSVCNCVDRRRLVMAACDCAWTALGYVTVGDEGPREAIETARAWCFGRVSLAELQRAADAVHDRATSGVTDNYAAEAAESAAYASLDTAVESTARAAADSAREAAAEAATLWDTTYSEALREMASLVERWIPLPVILLSMLGYPDAIPLNLDGVQFAEKPRSNPGHRNHNTPRGRR